MNSSDSHYLFRHCIDEVILIPLEVSASNSIFFFSFLKIYIFTLICKKPSGWNFVTCLETTETTTDWEIPGVAAAWITQLFLLLCRHGLQGQWWMSDGISLILCKIHAWSGSQGQKTKLAGSLHLVYCSCSFRDSGEALQCGGGRLNINLSFSYSSTQYTLLPHFHNKFICPGYHSKYATHVQCQGRKVILFGWANMNLFKKSTRQMQSDSAIPFLPSPVKQEVYFGSNVY